MQRCFFVISGGDKAKKYWDQIFTLNQKILKINITLKSESFFLVLIDKKLERKFEILLLSMLLSITA